MRKVSTLLTWLLRDSDLCNRKVLPAIFMFADNYMPPLFCQHAAIDIDHN